MNMENYQQPANMPYPEEESLDIKKYIFLILSRWWMFAITIFVSVTIAYLINRYSTDLYRVDCSMVLGQERSQAGGIDNIVYELTRTKNSNRKALVENEISILQSYALTRRAIELLPEFNITYMSVGRRGIAETQLYKDSPFVVVPDSNLINQPGIRVDIIILSEDKYRIEISTGKEFSRELKFGETFHHPLFNFTIYLKHGGNLRSYYPQRYYFYFNNIHNLTNIYRSKLAVNVNGDRGSILSLSMNGDVPGQVSDFLNKICQVYIMANLEEKNQVSDNTISFIDEQLRGIVDSLESAGLRLQKFRSSNKLIDLSKEGNFLIEQIEQLQNDKSLLTINLRYYNYLLDYIKNKKASGDIIAPSVVGISDELLNSLVIKLNELSLQLQGYESAAREDLPLTVELKSQINSVQATLQANLESLIEASDISMTNLDSRIQKIDAEVRKLPLTERQYINIQRDFNINDQIYTFLLEKRAEAGIAKASNIADHKVLDKAMPENAIHIKPKTSSNYMMALILGFLFPLAVIFLIEYFNNKILSKSDIEHNTRVPILGSVGHNDKASEIPVFEGPKTALAESFRGLRSSLYYMLKGKDKKVVAVTSAISGEGKTFCAVNLATIMAMSGKRTLLIGLDLRRPKIHRIFNQDNKSGLSTYLINRAEEKEVIRYTNIENLSIVNSGPIPPNPAELVESDRMSQFIEHAKKDFDYVVIDTPPVAIVTDAMLLKDHIDTYIFVVRHDYSSKNVLNLVDELYIQRNMKNMCIMVNDIQVRGYYGYNYSYSYGYGYSYQTRHNYYDEEEEPPTFKDRVKNFFKIYTRIK